MCLYFILVLDVIMFIKKLISKIGVRFAFKYDLPISIELFLKGLFDVEGFTYYGSDFIVDILSKNKSIIIYYNYCLSNYIDDYGITLERDSKDLYYSFQHVNLIIDNDNNLLLIKDYYDFKFRTSSLKKISVANFLNDLGYILEKLGFITPYEIIIKIPFSYLQ